MLELRPDVVPRTVANFEALLEGRDGRGYAGKALHRIVPGLCLQGGECGPSIYGKRFRDESFALGHLGYGTLYMANRDEPHTAGSQFFVCLAERFTLHVKFVAFGRVLPDGLPLLRELEALGTNRGHTLKPVTIQACGRLPGPPPEETPPPASV